MASYRDIEAGPSHSDGLRIGNAAADLVGLYGVTPVNQPSGAAQVVITDSSGGTASDTIAAIGATYDQAEVRNAVATLAAKVIELRRALVELGAISGAA